MNSPAERRFAVMGLAATVLLSTGCALTPWRGKQTAEYDAEKAYIERTAANIQYDTVVAGNGITASHSRLASEPDTIPSRSQTPRTASSGSGGSCCH